jgi:hypothetical protein
VIRFHQPESSSSKKVQKETPPDSGAAVAPSFTGRSILSLASKEKPQAEFYPALKTQGALVPQIGALV